MRPRDVLKRLPGVLWAYHVIRRRLRPRPGEWLLKRLPRNGICAEIGVHEGDFSASILRSLNPGSLYLVDPWAYEEGDSYRESKYGGSVVDGQREMDARCDAVRRRFASEISRGQVVVTRAPSKRAAGQFVDGYFDWVYIDGNHLYDFVKQDLDAFAPKIKVGGILAGDDYGETGWWDNGVQKAVDEFVASNPVYALAVRGSQFVITCGSAPDSAAGMQGAW